MSARCCEDCRELYDTFYQRGACPHGRYDPETVEMLEFNRDYPSYLLKHKHRFSGYDVPHSHYVNKGKEWDEAHHHHPVLEARYAAMAEMRELPKDEHGFSLVAEDA